jgi:acyl-CoA thioesterase-1
MGLSLIRRHCIALGVLAILSGTLPAWAASPPTGSSTILVVGDSLSAEYGLKRGSGWVALMEQRLAREKVTALQMTQDNLQAMAVAAQGVGAKVVLIGMQVPPNYGQDYANRFVATFATVAKLNKTALVPFMLKDVADVPDAPRLFQSDRLHPNEAAHPIILNNVWPTIKKLIP